MQSHLLATTFQDLCIFTNAIRHVACCVKDVQTVCVYVRVCVFLAILYGVLLKFLIVDVASQTDPIADPNISQMQGTFLRGLP